MDTKALTLTASELEELLDRAANKGARLALETLGLHDEAAGNDLKELRSFLTSWRDTKSVIWQTIARVVTTGIMLFLGTAMWLYFKTNISGK